ncbi:TolC family outer membrane protein [Marinobacterium jannaschii]|uniref:TolC family outer membrane protein n=1 Tax=Marinobacterium jannaschii TaxID=64970 RepID=UPI0004859877|nr:TolC family outer membrane protein [Marinobacterium jannaschii]
MKLSKAFSVSTLLVASLQAVPASAGTLADIYREAVKNDPQLRAAQASYRATAETLPQAKAGLLPDISLSGNQTWNDTDSKSFDNTGLTLSLTQPVFDASRWYSFQRGKVISEQARLQFDQSAQNLIFRTVDAYLNVLRAINNLETNQAQERAIKRRLDQVNAQYEVGQIAITDVQEAQASYDNARVARIEAEGDLDNSYDALERLTGSTVNEVETLRDNYPIEAPEPPEAKPWLEKARKQNLGIQISDASVRSARENIRISRAGHSPTVNLNASYDYDDGSFTTDDSIETTSIGLSFKLPLYQGGGTSSRILESEYRLTEAMENREDTLRDVTQQTRGLLRNLRTDVLSVSARAQSIKSSETALEATELGYNEGTRNVVDVLNAEQQLYAAQRDYANARFGYVTNLFRFKQQIGTLNPDDIEVLDQWLESAK